MNLAVYYYVQNNSIHSSKMPTLNDLLDDAMSKYASGDVVGFSIDIASSIDLYVQAIIPSCDDSPTVIDGLERVV